VNKVVFEHDKAVGVQITPRDGSKSDSSVIKAKKEVILAAGAIHTPQILQLSGIGPASLLKKAKIPIKVDLPGVGANFQDHYYIPGPVFSCAFDDTVPIPPPASLSPKSSN
jgi:choline dehydrogenase-like flavoprotein